MLTPLGFKPSSMGEGWYITAYCQRCGECRYLGRQYMIEKAGDVPVRLIEPRVRCFARPLSNKRGPACEGRMKFEVTGPPAASDYHPDHNTDGP